jgi:hypothetical protein
MKKFLIRNDDVAFDTRLEEIERFCDICDKYGYPILQAITIIGECRKSRCKMSNEEIRAASSRLFSENKEVLDYLKNRKDLIGVHGLWHSHEPTEEEIRSGKFILQGLGFTPTYFVPPFNEGKYPAEVAGLKVCTLSIDKGERLEDFLKRGTPAAEVMYLHSWRFDNEWYTFEKLEECFKRLQ